MECIRTVKTIEYLAYEKEVVGILIPPLGWVDM